MSFIPASLASVYNMMSTISVLFNFFNYSPGRQGTLEANVNKYPNAANSKLLPLCQTRWVEHLNALEVTSYRSYGSSC